MNRSRASVQADKVRSLLGSTCKGLLLCGCQPVLLSGNNFSFLARLTVIGFAIMQSCTGFKRGAGTSVFEALLWLLAALAPCQAARLLQPCSLHQAEYVLVQVSSLKAVMLDR